MVELELQLQLRLLLIWELLDDSLESRHSQPRAHILQLLELLVSLLEALVPVVLVAVAKLSVQAKSLLEVVAVLEPTARHTLLQVSLELP
jgi:hypothetical protein